MESNTRLLSVIQSKNSFRFTAKGATKHEPPPVTLSPKRRPDEIFPRMFERKTLLLREASELQTGTQAGREQSIVFRLLYRPLPGWTPQKNSADLCRDRVARREQYSWKVDFDDFKLPFYEHVADKLAVVAEEDAAIADEKRLKDQRKFSIIKPLK